MAMTHLTSGGALEAGESTAAQVWRGGDGAVKLAGTFGATVTLEYSADGGTTWASVGALIDDTGDMNPLAQTQETVFGFRLPSGKVRVTVANTGAPAVEVWMSQIYEITSRNFERGLGEELP